MPGASPTTEPPSFRTFVAAGIRGHVLPLAVLLAGGVIAAWVFVLLRQGAVNRDEAYLDERIAEVQAAIEVRMEHYEDALQGGAGLFLAASPLQRDVWHTYTESLHLRQRYPGINGLGIVLAVPPEGLAAWQETLRCSGQPPAEILPFPGTPDAAPTATKYLITYLDGGPADKLPIGRNIATEPSRRRAAELARDSGEPRVNHRIAGSRDTQRRAGLLLYVPLYRAGAAATTVAERRAALVGWVYAQIFPDVFLQALMGSVGNNVRLDFFEGGAVPSPATRMYASDPGATLPQYERMTQLTLAGAPFQLGWRRGPRFPAADQKLAPLVAGALGLATVFLAGLVLSLQLARQRTEALVDARTAELAASEERFRNAFDLSGIGMAFVGLDGRLLRVNQSLCEIVGYSEPRLRQKTFQDITHPADLALDMALLEELIAGKRRFYQLEKRYLHREGHSVWIRLTASLIRDAAGTPLHAIAQIEDITERKRLENSLAKARDEAVQESRHKSEFFATMVEEIRQPAAEVIQATTRLQSAVAHAPLSEELRAIRAAAAHFVAVLNDIVDFSKLELGAVELAAKPFNLRECLESATADFADAARQRHVRLELAIANGVPERVAGDPARLRQILVNLVGAAVRRAQAAEVRINLAAEARDAASGRQRLKFAVREVRASTHHSTPVAPPSDTLSLAISKRLTELMNGTLWTETTPERGTTVHFTVAVEPRAVAE